MCFVFADDFGIAEKKAALVVLVVQCNTKEISMGNKPIVIVASALMLCIALFAVLIVIENNNKMAAGMNVGDVYPAASTHVHILDGTIPVGAFGYMPAISTRVTDRPVTLTVAAVNHVTRTVTFNVSVPAGYRFVLAHWHTTSGSTAVSTGDTATMRNIVESGVFPASQFTMSFTVSGWNNFVLTGNAHFFIFIVPVMDTAIDIEFETFDTTFLDSFTTIHPNVLPTPPSSSMGKPFRHWSTVPNGDAVRGYQLVDGVKLYAVYFKAPTGLLVDDVNGRLIWDAVAGATSYRVYVNNMFMATVSHSGAMVPQHWSFMAPTSLRPEFGPGTVWEGKLDFRVVAVMGTVNSLPSDTVTWTGDVRQRLPEPTIALMNFRTSGGVLLWDVPSTMTYEGIHIEFIGLDHMGTQRAVRAPLNVESFMRFQLVEQFTDPDNISVRLVTAWGGSGWYGGTGRYFVSPSIAFDWSDFPSVGAPPLDAPTPIIIVEDEGYFLRWNDVAGAVAYSISISDNTEVDDRVRILIIINTESAIEDGRISRSVCGDYLTYKITGYIMQMVQVFPNMRFAIEAIPDDFTVNATSNIISEGYVAHLFGTRQIQLKVENLRIENDRLIWDQYELVSWLMINTQTLTVTVLANGNQIGFALWSVSNWSTMRESGWALNNMTVGGTYEITVQITSATWLFPGTIPGAQVPLLYTPTGVMPAPSFAHIQWVTGQGWVHMGPINRFVWHTVPNAVAYRLYIRTGPEQWTAITGDLTVGYYYLDENALRTQFGEGRHHFRVRAILDRGVSPHDSELSSGAWAFFDVRGQTQLAAPVGIMISGQNISWISGNPTGTHYRITIDDVVHTVNTNSFVRSVAFTAGRSYQISIVSFSQDTSVTDYIDSFAFNHTHVVLGSIANLTLVDGVLSWDAVYGADGYIVTVNGVEVNVATGSGNRISEDISEHLKYGDNIIVVRADGADDQYTTQVMTYNIPHPADNGFDIITLLVIGISVLLALFLSLLIVMQRKRMS